MLNVVFGFVQLPKKLFKRNLRYVFSLFFISSFFLLMFYLLFSLQTSVSLFKPYYLIEYPSYNFILSAKSSQTKTNQECNALNKDYVNFRIKIDNQSYPKIVPLFQNDSINFTCLNLNKVKKILLWNSFNGVPLYQIKQDEVQGLLKNYNCPVTNCDISLKRSDLNTSDMILFHMRAKIDEFPRIRFSDQRWVYVIYESQQHCPMCSKLDGLFNLSATFRHDSDITSIYLLDSGLKWVQNNPNFNESDYSLDSKPGFGVILISDCSENLKRIEIIKELRQYMPIDIYGKCSDQGLTCPDGVNCRQYLANRYKYLFAFENSICDGYITEKFFDTLKYNILPIVLGAGNYSHYFPKSSFINLLDYVNLKDLANYLNYLSSNQTAYSEYFKWKKYVVYDNINRNHSYLCEMCVRLQLEELVGIEHKTFYGHSKFMGMNENCKNLKLKREHDLNTIIELYSNNLKMKYYESS